MSRFVVTYQFDYYLSQIRFCSPIWMDLSIHNLVSLFHRKQNSRKWVSNVVPSFTLFLSCRILRENCYWIFISLVRKNLYSFLIYENKRVWILMIFDSFCPLYFICFLDTVMSTYMIYKVNHYEYEYNLFFYGCCTMNVLCLYFMFYVLLIFITLIFTI